MPRFECSDKADAEWLPLSAWLQGHDLCRESIRINAIGNDVDFVTHAGRAPQIIGHFVRYSDQSAGSLEGSLRGTLGAGAIHQRTIGHLFLDQGRVDLEQSWHSRLMRVLHAGKTPK